MKKLALALAVLLMTATTIYANPFLVATKGTGGEPTTYEFAGLPLTPTIIPAQHDGNFMVDLSTIPVGTYTVTIRASNLWGVSEYSSPFTFERVPAPGKPGAPSLLAQ